MVNDSSSSRELWAKSEPPVSLPEHAASVASTTVRLLDSPVVTERLDACGATAEVSRERIQDLGRLAGQLHDAGKAHPDWQAACHDLARGDDVEQEQLPPHSARSALYAFAAVQERGLPRLQGIAVSLAILHHHTPLISRSMRADRISRSVDDLSGLAEMCDALSAANFPPVTIDKGIRDSFLNAVSHYHALEPREDEHRPLGTLVTILRSALVQADHHASAEVGGGVASLPRALAPTDLTLFETLRPFQERIDEVSDPRLIGLAGCGEGKTHSALQWGQRMIAEGRANRLIFAMPTQVTTNNLLLSLTGGAAGDDLEHVPPEAAALYHSASEAFYDAGVAVERWDLSEASLDRRARRWFQRPVTVTTVDHVLGTLVNGYDWASLARGNLLQSAVVFDELHAYDAHTTGHILGGIAALERVGVPWYVMSATIPPQIREHSSLDGATEVQSEGRINASLPPREPFTIRIASDSLDAASVLERADDSAARRIMVVRNTVAGARKVARDLLAAGEEVVYYSSAFTQDHRERKEQEIRRRFGGEYDRSESRQFLVCTQVCEISLDLSADLLLTDVAPIDALIQRAGRLHRPGVAPDAAKCHDVRGGECPQCVVLPPDHEYKCIVHTPLEDHDRWLPYASDRDSTDWEILERTSEVLTDADRYRFDRSLGWVDTVYDGLPIDYDASRLIQASHKDWLYGDARRVAPDADSGHDDLQIRDISSYRRAVFMRQYREPDGATWTPSEQWRAGHECPRRGRCGVHADETTACDHAFWRFTSRHAVEIPNWWLQSDDHPVTVIGRVNDGDGAIKGSQIASVDYTYTLGPDPQTSG